MSMVTLWALYNEGGSRLKAARSSSPALRPESPLRKIVMDTIEFGETHVTINKRSGSRIVAGLLHKRVNERGIVTYAVLDRVVHDQADAYMGGYKTFGVVVTELTKDMPRIAG